MLYLIVSDKGSSELYSKSNFLSVSQIKVQQKQCFEITLVAFIRKYISNQDYVFGLIELHSNMPKKTQQFHNLQNIFFA